MSNKPRNSISTLPLILAIETATRAGSVAVARGQEIVAARAGDASASHSTDLIGNIDAALQNAGIGLVQVDLFAAAVGPGSFTGLRIGLATVKSLAVALDRKCAGVPTLAAVASAANAEGNIVALLPAGRGEVFAQMFRVRNGDVESREPPAHLSPPALAAKYGSYERITWAGEGAHAQLELLQATARKKGIDLHVNMNGGSVDGWTIAPPIRQLAGAVARLAGRQLVAGHVVAPAELRANYVRASDAELKSHA